MKAVSCLNGVEWITVFENDSSVIVTVLYVNFKVEQGLVAGVLRQCGTVSDMWWCTYGEGNMKDKRNRKRQFRTVLKVHHPSSS